MVPFKKFYFRKKKLAEINEKYEIMAKKYELSNNFEITNAYETLVSRKQ